MVSGLRVNLFKSKIHGFSLKADFVLVATYFLACGIGYESFVFLDIPIRINPRRREV